jgi:predicted phage terminase large subunit-like protein
MADFALTPRQQDAERVLNGSATHIMLAGGSRSGKTFQIVRKIVQRALKAPGSRHAILRFRLGHVRQSIVRETFPSVMAKAFPDYGYDLNQSELFATLPGDSEIWFGGLDDKQRTEKILGNEYASMFLNECSQISYGARGMAMTRLAQKVHNRATGRDLRLKMYYDENPPDKGHWTYKMFKLFEDPESRQQLNRDDYGFYQINPGDNQANISADYLKTLQALPERLRKRFLYGEFRDSAPNALFRDEWIERWRNIDDELPDMLRVVVAVDPSGADDTDNADNDEIGIVVCGLGIDGNGYVLEDLTCKAGPQTWGRVATQAFERHQADRIVAEVNYGGAMVRHVIHTVRQRTPFRAVTASRGKVVRAEPISSLVELGKIRMAGIFRELEDELCAFTTNGYMGENSPNRADAMVWAFSDLFPELVKAPEVPPQVIVTPRLRGQHSWMRSL